MVFHVQKEPLAVALFAKGCGSFLQLMLDHAKTRHAVCLGACKFLLYIPLALMIIPEHTTKSTSGIFPKRICMLANSYGNSGSRVYIQNIFICFLSRDLRKHLRRAQLQQESRRRAAVNEMIRQRAAEAAGGR